MVERVCVDASLTFMLLVREEQTPKAEALWQSWTERAFELITAPLFFAEVTSVLRQQVYFGRLHPERGERSFESFMGLGIHAVDLPDLQPSAWDLAKKYNRPRAYDAQYLAVASILRCDLWTGDRRLVNAVNEPWVRWVGDYASSTLK